MLYHFGRGRSKWIPYLLLLPGMGFYLVIALGPSLATALFSLTDATGLKGSPIHWVGLDNYYQFLFVGQAAKDNLSVLARTLVFCSIVSIAQFALGLAVAVILNQKIWGRQLFRTLYFMPVILGVVIQGLVWSLFLYPLGGPVSKLLGLMGMHSQFLGGQPVEAFYWVIVVQVWANMGITMIIFLAGLQTIPTELYESASIDGATAWKTFTHITWPLLTPSVNTNLTLNIIGSLQAWQLFLVMLGYRPGTQVLGYLIYATGFGSGGSMILSFKQGQAAAASIILFLLVLVIGLSVNRYLQRRENRILG